MSVIAELDNIAFWFAENGYAGSGKKNVVISFNESIIIIFCCFPPLLATFQSEKFPFFVHSSSKNTNNQ